MATITIGAINTMNKFKFSTLRQFGSENVSFTAEVESENATLTEDEVKAQVMQIDKVIREAFIAVQEREIAEKGLLAAASERRTQAVAMHDEALKQEMMTSARAKLTMQEAEHLDKKLKKLGK